MNNKTKTIFLALLFILSAVHLPADDKVAILVDELLENATGFSTTLSAYITEIKENFTNVDVLEPVLYDDYWSMDPMTEIRAVIERIYDTYNDLVGVILIGEIPLPVHQSFCWNPNNPNDRNNDTAFYYPVTLPYEDLYGKFDDNWTLDSGSLKTFGNDDYIDSWEMHTEDDTVDIWACLIRVTKEKYTYAASAVTYQAENATLGTGGPTPAFTVEPDDDCDGNAKVTNVSGGRRNSRLRGYSCDSGHLFRRRRLLLC